jgi:N-acetylmuramoyl-L-alanine amidase/Fibronectin type III domain
VLVGAAALGILLAAAPASFAARPAGGIGAAGIAHPPHRLPASLRRLRAVAPLMVPASGAEYPGALWEPASPANYTLADRPVDPMIRRIVIHVAEGGFASTYRWFQSASAQASAHYVVGAHGQVAQMVHERDIAWHAGNWAYNETSIGIEHAGYTDRTLFPDAQYRGSARLAAYLADRYFIVPDRAHVIGHSQVPDPFHPGQFGGADHHTDPGRTWHWRLYMAYLRADAHDTYQQVVDNSTPGAVRYSHTVWKTSSARPLHQGPDYLYTATHTPGHPVGYRFHVPATDSYDVFMRWPCNTAYNRHVTVGVATAGGYRSVAVDESRECTRGWNWLGSFRLAAGDATKLVVLSSSPDPGHIVADAFRIVEGSDPTPPTTPQASVVPQATSMQVAWTASTDDIRLGGYRVWVDSSLVYQGPARSTTVTGLHCGSAYTVSVRAVDLAGNTSDHHLLQVSTPECPTPPTGLSASGATRTGVTLSWDAGGPTVVGYNVYLNGVRVAQTSSTSYAYTGLACGGHYMLGVASYDAAGDVSAHSHVDTYTLAC